MVAGILAGRPDGLALDRVEFVQEAGEWFLRVFLDHPAGVTLEHCQEISTRLGEMLDAADPIPHSYRLEVSSPGLERPLRTDADFERFRGRLATVHLYQPTQGKKVLTGNLAGLGPRGEILLDVPAVGEVRVPRASLAKAHLAVDWAKAGLRPEAGAGPKESGGGTR